MTGNDVREWYIDITETFDMDEKCESGLAYTQGYLDVCEMTPHEMIHVIRKSDYDALLAKAERLAEAIAEHVESEPGMYGNECVGLGGADGLIGALKEWKE